MTGKTDDPAVNEFLNKLGASSIVKRSDFESEPKPLAKEIYAGAVDTIGSKVLCNILSQVNPDDIICLLFYFRQSASYVIYVSIARLVPDINLWLSHFTSFQKRRDKTQ